MTADEQADLVSAARAAFARRGPAQEAVAGQAEALTDTCLAMARRFAVGGKLLAFGSGGPTTDAQHVSVEFVHPVIMGKRALPAVSLAADVASTLGLAHHGDADDGFAGQVLVLGNANDIALGISSGGDDEGVLRGLRAARKRGLLTVALLGGDGGRIVADDVADHVFVVPSGDAHIVKEVHVTGYHVLWEMVHAFLEHPGIIEGTARVEAEAGTVEALYPFLYEGTASMEDLRVQVRASIVDKATEVARLRARVSDDLATALADAAAVAAAQYARGAKLLTCGNGGSSADAQEVATDHLAPPSGLRPIPALCLTNDVAVLTALSNDVSFEVVFARQVRAFGVAGDVLLALSTSGNSANVIAAFAQARAAGMTTVGFAGNDGGAMRSCGTIDHLFVIPSSSVHRIQEAQTTCYHVLRELVDVALGRWLVDPERGGLPAPAVLTAPGPARGSGFPEE